jgi:hypothetical protein
MPRKKSFIEEDDVKDESKLIEMLKNDEKLREEPDYRMAMISQATMFLEDFGNNIYLTSIEMHEKVPFFSIDAWKDFLNYPLVRKYIKSFKDEKISMAAEQGLAEGDKGALGIKKAMDSTLAVNNSNIVLIRLPEKKDF